MLHQTSREGRGRNILQRRSSPTAQHAPDLTKRHNIAAAASADGTGRDVRHECCEPSLG